jgi:transcriptional regulator with GAF, ATPase, and Fis domain
MGAQKDSAALGRDSVEILPGVLGTSFLLREAAAKVRIVAEADATCLLSGETGTGKELFARAVHYLSSRKDKPFVPVNCGAIPDQLFENEFFGHVRGAFTDAGSPETGLLAYASTGTLFLDEVDSLSLSAQVKLLRVLQEHEYRPVGSARMLRTDARILAATNGDLPIRVQNRQFREDLFHRINVLRLNIPSLRERPEDIPLLAVHFVREYAQQHRRPVLGIDPGAIDALLGYRWPGNVRELQGVLQRAVLVARDPQVAASDLDLPGAPAAVVHGTLKDAKNQAVRQVERAYIVDVLRRFGGNVSRAAHAAGKERRTFQRLLHKYQIAAAPFREAAE